VKKQATPYIGVSCVREKDEINTKEICDLMDVSLERKVMIGTASSLKTIGGLPVNKSERSAFMSELPTLFTDHPLAFNIIHHNAKGRELETLGEQLKLLSEFAGPNLHGFQLNIFDQDINIIRDVREFNPKLKFILNVGQNTLISCNNDPEIMSAYFNILYKDMIDYALLDLSGVLGKLIEPERLKPFIEHLSKDCPWLSLCIAGRLGPDNLNLIAPLLRDFPNIPIDAETALRDPETDKLSADRVRRYMRNSQAIIKNLGLFHPNSPIGHDFDIGGEG